MTDFIDYVTLMLLNMISALVILAFFLWWGLGRADRRSWAPAFGIAGLVATVSGFAMTFTWPIPKPYSMAYGEMSVLLGVLFLGAAWALARDWSLLPLGIYAFFPGATAIVIGVRMIHLSLTQAPVLAGAGFILTGLGGVFAGLALWKQEHRGLRMVGGLVMLAAAALWIPTAYLAYWLHMQVQPPSNSSTSAELRGNALEPGGTPSASPAPSAAHLEQHRKPARAGEVYPNRGADSSLFGRVLRAAQHGTSESAVRQSFVSGGADSGPPARLCHLPRLQATRPRLTGVRAALPSRSLPAQALALKAPR